MSEPKTNTKVNTTPVKATAKPKAATTVEPPSPTTSNSPVEAKEEVAVENSKEKVAEKPAAIEEKPEESLIDMGIFGQILELDDDDDREFSKEMVLQYFSQVGSTFEKMEDELKSKNLRRLSELGHFLKGSSAALGVTKVQDSCTKIQHYGELRDEEKDISLKPTVALSLITDLLAQVKLEYAEAESWLKTWFDNNSSQGLEDAAKTQ